MRAWRAQLYILKDIVPSFLLGVLVFVLVLLLFQSLRLTEFVLVHGVSSNTILHIVYSLVISFFPAILPMSCLFAVLMTYGRLGNDSELIGLKAIGLNIRQIGAPAILFGSVVSLITLYCIFVAGPKGNKEFEVIATKLNRQATSSRIQEGTFSSGFQNMVIYTHKYNPKKGLLEKVFIYNEISSGQPTTIVANRGQIIQSNNFGDSETILRLIEGSIHQPNQGSYTKIDFETYDIFASNNVNISNVKWSPPSLSFTELIAESKLSIPPGVESSNPHAYKAMMKRKRAIEAEIHKRFAIGLLPLIFSLLGLGIGAVANKRAAPRNGFVSSMLVIIVFWVFYITGENMAKDGKVSPAVGIWFSDFAFLAYALYKLRNKD